MNPQGLLTNLWNSARGAVNTGLGLLGQGNKFLQGLNSGSPQQTVQQVGGALGAANKFAQNINQVAPIGNRALAPQQNTTPQKSTLPAQFQAKTQTPITSKSTQNGTQPNYQQQVSSTQPISANRSEAGVNLNPTSEELIRQQLAQQIQPQTPQSTLPELFSAQQANQTGLGAPQPQFTPQTPYNQYVAAIANLPQNDPDVINAQKALQDAQIDYAQKLARTKLGGIDTALSMGEKGVLQEEQHMRLAALQGGLSTAQEQQKAQLGALGTAAGLTEPELASFTQQAFYPSTGQFSGVGQFGTGPEAAGKIQSVQDLTQQASQIQSVFNGAEANFKLLLDTARQGGVNQTNVPIINAIQQNIARGLTSNAAVTNFRNTLATIRAQYAQILGGGTATVDSNQRAAQAIPDDISLDALQSLQSQLHAEGTNRVNGINEQIKSLSGGQTNTSGFKEGQLSSDGGLIFKGGGWKVNK